MSDNILKATADVLEKIAAYVDAVETEKVDSLNAERTKAAEALRSRYSEVTGEQISDEMVSKLASSDEDVLGLFEKLAGSAQAPDSMGGPGESRDTTAMPQTKKEAAAAADERFLTWLTQ